MRYFEKSDGDAVSTAQKTLMQWHEEKGLDLSPKYLAPGEIHVWTWHLGAGIFRDQAQCVLSAAEEERMQALRFKRDRDNYLVSHVQTRYILSRYLRCAPKQISFSETLFGKPFLSGGDSRLEFNLSHCRTAAALGVVSGSAIGVDVEDIHAVDAGVSEQSFSRNELTELADLRKSSHDEWLQGFYNCWTRKEAVLKAEGVGLNVRLDSFDVSLKPGRSAEILRLSSESGLSRQWYLSHFEPFPGVIGTIATAELCSLQGFRLTADVNG